MGFNSFFRGTIMSDGLDLAEKTATGIEEGFRSELVSISDVEKVDDMTKDQLAEYALSRFNITLNKGEKVKFLKFKVINSIREKLKHPEAKADPKAEETRTEIEVTRKPEFMWNPKNRRVFEWTTILAKRGELIECYIVDKKGKLL
jgi:hypothetical protein